MNASEILTTLETAGLSVAVADGQWLDVWPSSRLTDGLRAMIRDHKAELIERLNALHAPDDPVPVEVLCAWGHRRGWSYPAAGWTCADCYTPAPGLVGLCDAVDNSDSRD